MPNLVNCKYRNEDNINDNNTKICGIDIGLTVKSVPIHVKLPIENLTNGNKGKGKKLKVSQEWNFQNPLCQLFITNVLSNKAVEGLGTI